VRERGIEAPGPPPGRGVPAEPAFGLLGSHGAPVASASPQGSLARETGLGLWEERLAHLIRPP
jgi:hypothetical protein